MNWYELRSKCIDHVAREIARPRVKKDSGWAEWPKLTQAARPEAVEKINAMTNFQLLGLFAEVVGKESA